MATLRMGYFRIPPREIGATLIFTPAFTGAIRAQELALWARDNGFEEITYVPAARFVERQHLEH